MAKRSPMPVDVLVGQNIRTQRLQKGLSQTELGTRIGVTFQQVQKYEKGTNRVGGSRLVQIADALGVETGALLPASGAAAGKRGSTVPKIMMERVGLEVVKAWPKLSPPLKLAIKSLIDALP